MKTSLKLIFLDRTIMVLSSLFILILIFTLTSSVYVRNMEEENKALKIRLDEIQTFTEDVIHMKSIVESKEKKIGLRKTKGVVSTLEQVLNKLGLKAKVLKPLNKFILIEKLAT